MEPKAARMTQISATPIGRGALKTITKKGGQPLLSLGLLLFSLLLIVGFADFRGDYAFVWGRELRRLIPDLGYYTTWFYTIVLCGLAVFGVSNLLRRRSAFRAGPGIKLFFVLLATSTIWGVVVGLINGVSFKFILGDVRNVIVYPSVFAISSVTLNSERGVRYLRNLFFIACGVVLFKLALSLASDLLLGDSIGWRFLYKTSVFFVPMLLLALAMFIFSVRSVERRRYLLLFAVAAIALFLTQVRSYFIGSLAGIAVILGWCTTQTRVVRFSFAVVSVLLIGIIIALVVVHTDVQRVFGFWDRGLGSGLDYRGKQAKVLMSTFTENWLMGTGSGSFDTTYDDPTYQWTTTHLGELTSRPYLSELELLNMLVKLGVIAFGLLLAAFAILFRECTRMAKHASSRSQRGFVLGLAAGMVALLTVALTSTAYSSLYFHLYVVIILLVLSALRADSTTSRQTNTDTANR
jgi:hypothetical protein